MVNVKRMYLYEADFAIAIATATNGKRNVNKVKLLPIQFHLTGFRLWFWLWLWLWLLFWIQNLILSFTFRNVLYSISAMFSGIIIDISVIICAQPTGRNEITFWHFSLSVHKAQYISRWFHLELNTTHAKSLSFQWIQCVRAFFTAFVFRFPFSISSFRLFFYLFSFFFFCSFI